MKIGIFGGTFDPVHTAHLRAAEEFAEALKLDRVLMMPASIPPHRPAPAASPSQRLSMLKLALSGNPRLEVSELELGREGPSYTIDTIDQLRPRLEGQAPALALGADAYGEIASWHRPWDVLARAHVVVLARPGARLDLLSPLPEEIQGLYRAEGNILLHAEGGTLRTLSVTLMDVSSSRIRTLVAEGSSIRYLVPEKVYEYIRASGLYTASGRH